MTLARIKARIILWLAGVSPLSVHGKCKFNHEGEVLELTGPEGFTIKKLKVSGLQSDGCVRKVQKQEAIRLYVKVVGFVDTKASVRNWGMQELVGEVEEI